MTDDELNEIRPAIINLIMEKKPVRLGSILQELNKDKDWKYGKETLRKAMLSLGIGFNLHKSFYYDRLREDPENCLRRAKYLKYFFQYVKEDRIMNFFDETWFNKNMVEKKEWSDGSAEFDRGVPSGKGDRWIVLGVGNNKTGWKRNLFKMWTADSSKGEDYHGNMDAAIFETFVKKYMEEAEAEDRSVLVIDRAPYHMQLTDETRRATKGMKRDDLADWIISHDVKDSSGFKYEKSSLLINETQTPKGRKQKGKSKQELYEICRENDPKPKYKVQQWFDEYNGKNPGRDLKVLILPVATPQLNPIENMWGQQKEYITKYNFEYTMAKVQALAMKKFNDQSAEDWDKQYKKMLRFAEDQWDADEILLNNAETNELEQDFAALDIAEDE